MWELPQERHYTSLEDRLPGRRSSGPSQLARGGHIEGDTDRWRREAEAIRAFVEEECWSEKRGAYAFYAGHDRPRRRRPPLGRPAGLPSATGSPRRVEAIREELGEGPLLYRYSGMRGEEGAFLACSFWLVGVLVRLERVDEAASLMSELVELGNDVGLFSEEIDPATRELLGNFPQGLTHLALINAAHELEGGTTWIEVKSSSSRGRRPASGAPIAIEFARHGAKVALLARSRAGLEGAKREVEEAGGEALPLPTDVADYEQVLAAAAAAEEAFGPIDVWVNDAMTTIFGEFVEIEADEYRRATEVTYLGHGVGDEGGARAHAAARPRLDRPGRLRAGLPRHPAPGAVLRRRSTRSRGSSSRCAASCGTAART